MEIAKRAGRHEWLALTVLVLPTFLVALDMTSLFLALPRLSADLRPSGVEQLWITDGYGFMVAAFVITMGTLGDRIGRRRLLLAGGAAFGAVSIAAAYAVNPAMLITARLLLGIAGATLGPSTLALISSMFRDGRQRGTAIAVWATCQFVGGALGPVVSGFLLQRFWWGSVFLIAVPVMALLLLAGPVLLPEYRDPQAARPDLVSVALSLGAVLPMVYGLKELTVGGDLAMPLGSIAVGVAVGVVFVRRQLTLDAPLLDLRLFAGRPFTAVLVALVFAGVAMAGTGLLVSQYLQSVLGYSPLTSALLFAPMGLGVAAGTIAAPALTRWMRPATAISAGLGLSVPGCLLLTQAAVGPAAVMAGIAVLALGTGPLFALGTGLVVGSAPPERAGSAASMSETGNYFGGAMGLAVIGSIAAIVYRAHAPSAAGRTLSDATAAARRLPPEQAAGLLRTAKSAFTAGLNLTGVITAMIFGGLAVLIAAARRTDEAPAEIPELQAAGRP